MTYNDVYKKFMIEYDKADISSSYPSLTPYEAATILDKALLALITQKVTGNNPRQTVLDSDIKASSDIQQLLVTSDRVRGIGNASKQFRNEKLITPGPDLMYLIKLYITRTKQEYTPVTVEEVPDFTEVAQATSSIFAEKYRQTPSNKPWLKTPMCYLENGMIHLLLDPTNVEKGKYADKVDTPIYTAQYYVKKPSLFTEKTGDKYNILTQMGVPLPDHTCEELVNLAIIYACKSVENPRIATEIQTKSLEA